MSFDSQALKQIAASWQISFLIYKQVIFSLHYPSWVCVLNEVEL